MILFACKNNIFIFSPQVFAVSRFHGLRITVQGQTADIMVKRSIPVHLWNQAKECSNGKQYKDKELNHYLETVKAKFYQIHRELEIDGKKVTANAVRDRYHGKDESSKTLVDVYKEHNRKCRALIGIDFTESTVEKFDTSLARLQEYIKYKNGTDDILLSDINTQFIQDFDFYLKTVRKCQHNSSLKHLKNLKKIIRIALANDWIKKDPFYGIQFKHEETNIEFLTQEELERLIHKEFPVQRLAQVRDIFVFCSFTGLAFTDVQQLTPNHLMKDNNGAIWIRKNRQKTGNMCNIPILSVAQRLIEKYQNHPDCIRKGILMPVMSNQKMNAYLKELADLCEINKKLTTHTFRHTFATLLLEENVDIRYIQSMLGHSTITTTQIYTHINTESQKKILTAKHPRRKLNFSINE